MKNITYLIAGLFIMLLMMQGQTVHAALTCTLTSPSANARNINAETKITAEFSEAINASTVDNTSFIVSGAISGRHSGTFDVSGTQIIFTPDTSFFSGETVTAVLTEDIQGTSGAALSKPRVWQFRVKIPQRIIPQFTNSGQSMGNDTGYGVALGDINEDGFPDAIVANSEGFNKVWLNNGQGTFTQGQNMQSSGAQSVAIGDINNDGHLDAVIVNLGGSADVWLNDGAGNFTSGGQVPESILGGFCVALGDVDGNGTLDALVTSADGNQVWFNDGTGVFTDSGQIMGYSAQSLALGDLDNDGDLDAFMANSGANIVWLNDGKGTFTRTSQELGKYSSFGVALGDFNGDGYLDAVVANFQKPNRIWINKGTSSPARFDYTSLNNPSCADSSCLYLESNGAAVGDMDGDGDADAVIVNNAQANEFWVNSGTGIFSYGNDLANTNASTSLAVGDLDGDGDLDAFIVNNGQPDNVWRNDGTPALIPGDVDDNGIVELRDAILALQILVEGTDSEDSISLADVDGDERIGTAEAIFVLQTVSNSD